MKKDKPDELQHSRACQSGETVAMPQAERDFAQPALAQCTACATVSMIPLPSACRCGGAMISLLAKKSGKRSDPSRKPAEPVVRKVDFERDQSERLQAWASSRNVSFDEAVREAVKLLLDRGR